MQVRRSIHTLSRLKKRDLRAFLQDFFLKEKPPKGFENFSKGEKNAPKQEQNAKEAEKPAKEAEQPAKEAPKKEPPKGTKLKPSPLFMLPKCIHSNIKQTIQVATPKCAGYSFPILLTGHVLSILVQISKFYPRICMYFVIVILFVGFCINISLDFAMRDTLTTKKRFRPNSVFYHWVYFTIPSYYQVLLLCTLLQPHPALNHHIPNPRQRTISRSSNSKSILEDLVKSKYKIIIYYILAPRL